MAWPKWELDLVQSFMTVEPHPIERIEIGIAQLCSILATVHGRKGSAPPSVSDFLPYRQAWKQKAMHERYSESDLDALKAFGVI